MIMLLRCMKCKNNLKDGLNRSIDIMLITKMTKVKTKTTKGKI
jgi:hypothetical protein